MKENNPIKIKTRIQELAIDYLCISIYLVLLLFFNLLFYSLVLGGVPQLTILQSNIVTTLESVLPIIIIFSVLDYKKPFGTYGKRKSGLKVSYKSPSFFRSLIRNCIKFMPWQLAHMGVIEGVYTEYQSWGSIILSCASIALALLMFGMGICRKDKRHLGDLIAGTQVVSVDP